MIYNFKVSEYTSLNGWATQDFTEYVAGYNPFVGFSEVDSRITGQLNEGYIEFINNNIDNLPMFAIVTIEKIDNSTTPSTTKTTSYYIGSDKTEIIDKENNLVLHRVELVDLTKKLEKYTLETITFTNTSDPNEDYTVLQAIERLLRIARTQRYTMVQSLIDQYIQVAQALNYRNYFASLPNYNSYIVDYISTDMINACSNIVLPQTVLSNLTLREAINELLKVINAICYLDFDISTHKFYLKMEHYNEIKDLITNNISIDSKNQEHSTDDYSSELDNFVSNEVDDNNIKLNWFTNTELRTNESNYELTDSNFGVLLPNNIYALNKMIIRLVVNATDNSGNDVNFYPEVDISKYVVSEEVYEALEYKKIIDTTNVDEGSLYKSNTVYYNYKSNFINLSPTYKGFIFEKYSVINAIAMATFDHFKKYNLLQNFYNNIRLDIRTGSLSEDIFVDLVFDNNNSTTFKIRQKTAALDTLNKLENILVFNVGYKPILAKTRIKTQKEDTSEVKKLTSGFSNQKAKIISLQNIGLADKSQLERVGNQNYSITIRHKTLNSLYKNGDYTTDFYIITKSEYIYYDDYIIGKYDLTKNYQKLSEYIGINSEYRAFEIPSGKNVYERQIHFNTYCYVTKNNSFSTSNSYLSNAFMRNYVNTLKQINGNNYMLSALINIDNMESIWGSIQSGAKRLSIPVLNNGSGNNLIFQFTMFDNIAAGYIIKEQASKQLMYKVPYTIDGCFVTMSFGFVTSYWLNSYPLTSLTETDLQNDLSFYAPNFLVLKDSGEILDFIYELSLISLENKDLVINNDFFALNNSLTGISKTIPMYVYGSNNKYTSSDKAVKGTLIDTATNLITITQSNNHINVSFPTINNYNYEWFAIGNADEDIFLIAGTKEKMSSLDFWFSDERIDIDKTY